MFEKASDNFFRVNPQRDAVEEHTITHQLTEHVDCVCVTKRLSDADKPYHHHVSKLGHWLDIVQSMIPQEDSINLVCRTLEIIDQRLLSDTSQFTFL